MKNKEVQEQRIRGYFLQATKELLKGEGLKSISVRSIAQKAGYSYTTMYSYFRDVNELVFLCVHDFYEECKEHVKSHSKKKDRGIKSLRAAVKGYADWFIQYPGIFDLFFIEKISDHKSKRAVTEVINHSLDIICEEEWNYCLTKGLVQPESVELMKSQLRYMVLGLLMLYLNRRMFSSYTEFVNQFNLQLDAIFRNAGGGVAEEGVVVYEGSTTVKNSLISINVGNNR